ncbi:nitrite reductase [NAD(P)H], large subunit [Klebsiella variicola]|uniref:Nitrite reductase [NAD(P)H], large subunit n=1 Tax=Klebsiella variicola TaxID=244366 RepID=A0A7H4MMH2_KLEVA|nr:nitrite reductase [NAD(P)H], large subunit [Klebsiella variicola]
MVLEDSLGIGEELEQEMARIVDSYQCEWQTTLNDPQRLALFRSFVNSDQPDEAVQRHELRGQPQLLQTETLPEGELPSGRGRRYATLTPFRRRRGSAPA